MPTRAACARGRASHNLRSNAAGAIPAAACERRRIRRRQARVSERRSTASRAARVLASRRRATRRQRQPSVPLISAAERSDPSRAPRTGPAAPREPPRRAVLRAACRVSTGCVAWKRASSAAIRRLDAPHRRGVEHAPSDVTALPEAPKASARRAASCAIQAARGGRGRPRSGRASRPPPTRPSANPPRRRASTRRNRSNVAGRRTPPAGGSGSSTRPPPMVAAGENARKHEAVASRQHGRSLEPQADERVGAGGNARRHARPASHAPPGRLADRRDGDRHARRSLRPCRDGRALARRGASGRAPRSSRQPDVDSPRHGERAGVASVTPRLSSLDVDGAQVQRDAAGRVAPRATGAPCTCRPRTRTAPPVGQHHELAPLLHAAGDQRAGDDRAEAFDGEDAIDRQPHDACRAPARGARPASAARAARSASRPAPVRADTGTIGAPSGSCPRPARGLPASTSSAVSSSTRSDLA